jgi:hypothetical protein
LPASILSKLKQPCSTGVAQHRGQIETESIDAQAVAPVGQRIDDQVLRNRVARVVVATNAGVVPRVLGRRSASSKSGCPARETTGCCRP